MATTVISEIAAPNPLAFQNMLASSTQLPHSQPRRSLSPRFHPSDSSPNTPSSPNTRYSQNSWDQKATARTKTSETGGASRFPSPPSSSSESLAEPSVPKDGFEDSEASSTEMDSEPPRDQPQPAPIIEDSQPSFAAASIPSPASDDLATQQYDVVLPSSVSTDTIVVTDDGNGNEEEKEPECKTIHVRDLEHIKELARDDETGNGPGILNEPTLQSMKYDISAMPIHDIIEMVAALLTKITTTNDLQHDAMSRNATHQQHASSHGDGTREMSPFSSSVLAFHGKNVPAITILSYLARIHKYCPTTYEVFLSLLVYFDRMTERVNDIVMKSEQERQERERKAREDKEATKAAKAAKTSRLFAISISLPESPSVPADTDANMDAHTPAPAPAEADSDVIMHEASDGDDSLADDEADSPNPTKAATPAPQPAPATFFVVDSFNIHRLIIAGVTCASKFFSDVFYTNSRYAKVGGLPLAELNHLELQFLILNDFRLSVPVEDLEAYATMLVEFYARDVVAQRARSGSKASA